MLTARSIKFIALFIGFLVVGLILGNRILIAMSLAPFCVLLAGLLTEPPTLIESKLAAVKPSVRTGDVVEIKYEIRIVNGCGNVVFFQELPAYFGLVAGNNLRVFWKGLCPASLTFSYKMRCTKRGVYSLPPLKWEGPHVLRLTQTREGSLGDPIQIEVRPGLPNVRRIRGVPGIATSPFPVIDVAKIGVATTDFREIRNYVYGDPVKNINWKATCRNTSPFAQPLVNEYEVEGKKAVWVFLDASSAVEIGTDIENAFEYCLEAVNGVTYYFLDRGYRVGMYIFNDGGKLYYPDAGKRQFVKISRDLIGLKTNEIFDEFPTAIEKCRRYILGYNPLCVIVSRLDSEHCDSIIGGVKKLRQFRGRHTKKLPVMVISVPGHNLIPRVEEYDNNSALLLQLESRPRMQQLRRLGASVLEWNPKRESFGTSLLRLVKNR